MNRRIDARTWVYWVLGFTGYVSVLVVIAEVTHA